MNLDKLNYLLEVNRTRSLSTAASKLHISVSALSQAITSIEKEFGNEIFIRTRKGTTLTLFGKSFLKNAQELMDIYLKLTEDALSWNQNLKGDLRIATVPGIIHVLLKVIADIKRKHPDINVFWEEKGTQDIIDDLIESKLDIGIINIFQHKFDSPDLKFEHLIDGGMQMFFNCNYFSTKEKTLDPQILLEHDLMLYEDEAISWFIQELEKKYQNLKISFQTNNVDAIRIGITEQLGVTIALDYCIKHEPTLISGQNKAIYIKGYEIPTFQLGIATKIKSEKKLSTIFLESFKTHFFNNGF